MSEDNGELIRVRFIVNGRVQGVGYRLFVQRAARQHRVAGFVRNLPDGTVEVEAQATPERLRTFQLELSMGPPHAHVANVQRHSLSVIDGANEFTIL